MANCLEIIKSPINLSLNNETDHRHNNNSNNNAEHISNVLPIISITKIENISSQVSPNHNSKNTDFSIANLLKRDDNDDVRKKCLKSPRVKVININSVLDDSVKDNNNECSQSSSITTSSMGSCNSSDVDVDDDENDDDRKYQTKTNGRTIIGLKTRNTSSSSSNHIVRKRAREDKNDEDSPLYDHSTENYDEEREYRNQHDEMESYLNYRHHHHQYSQQQHEINQHHSASNNASSSTQHLLSQSKYLSPEDKANLSSTFSWLTCTRFKPPKLPRSGKKRVGCKRYGRGPRIPFAPHQIAVLEGTFSKSQYLSSDCIHRLADTLHLSETRVKIWFQNRRARYRREKEPQIGTAATIQLQQANTATSQQLRSNFRKNRLLLSHLNDHGDDRTDHPVSPKTDVARNSSPTSTTSSAGSEFQTDIELNDNNNSYVNEKSSINDHNNKQFYHHYQGKPNRLLMPDFLTFQLQQQHHHQHQHQQQLQQYYLEQQRSLAAAAVSENSRNSNNGSGNAAAVNNIVSTSPLLHSALQQQSQILQGPASSSHFFPQFDNHKARNNASKMGNIDDLVTSSNNGNNNKLFYCEN